jgi:hypothetical protein
MMKSNLLKEKKPREKMKGNKSRKGCFGVKASKLMLRKPVKPRNSTYLKGFVHDSSSLSCKTLVYELRNLAEVWKIL